MVNRRLPPLGALRAFEVLARRGTLANAADELCVTPSAVGHQVRALEAWLGAPLFKAQGRQRVLTAEGARLAGDIGKGFDQLEFACRAVAQGSRLPLVSPRNTFRTSDGGWIAISGGAHAVFQRLCAALDVPELAQDLRFSDNRKRLENADAIEQALQEAVGKLTLKEAATRLREHDAPGASVFSVADVFEDPHIRALANITSVSDAELNDNIQMPNVIGKFSETPGAVRHAAPRLGSSNREVLIEELGLDEQDLTAAGLAF